MTPDQVDLLAALEQFRRHIPTFAQRVMLGDVTPAEWLTLTDLLIDLFRLCRAQAIVDSTDNEGCHAD